jgi:hypothetical protein
VPAHDRFHNAVRCALEKELWQISSDPLYLKYGTDTLMIDLAADHFIVAERQTEQIAVEIKSFTKASDMSEFHSTLGQYLNYRMALEHNKIDRILFLAIPETAFKRFFQRKIAQDAIQLHKIRLIVFDQKNEVILQWI